MNLVIKLGLTIYSLAILCGCGGKKASDIKDPVNHNWSSEIPQGDKQQVTQPMSQSVGSLDGDVDPNTDLDASSYSGDRNPVSFLNLSSGSEIDQQKAQMIMTGMGMMGPQSVHKLSYQRSLEGVCQGVSYRSPRRAVADGGCKGVTLSTTIRGKTMADHLFQEYTDLRAALEKYADRPTIGQEATPALFEQWVREAAPELQGVPENKREDLMRSLMVTESGKTHWRNYIPISSQAGAVGIGQFLPATARDVGINPYDPADNIKGIAKYLNKIMVTRDYTIRQALMYYNGGSAMSQETANYADGILRRAGMSG